MFSPSSGPLALLEEAGGGAGSQCCCCAPPLPLPHDANDARAQIVSICRPRPPSVLLRQCCRSSACERPQHTHTNPRRCRRVSLACSCFGSRLADSRLTWHTLGFAHARLGRRVPARARHRACSRAVRFRRWDADTLTSLVSRPWCWVRLSASFVRLSAAEYAVSNPPPCFPSPLFRRSPPLSMNSLLSSLSVPAPFNTQHTALFVVRIAGRTRPSSTSRYPPGCLCQHLLLIPPSALPPSSFLLPPSSFLLPPSSFLPPPDAQFVMPKASDKKSAVVKQQGAKAASSGAVSSAPAKKNQSSSEPPSPPPPRSLIWRASFGY